MFGRHHKILSRDLQGTEICGIGHLRRQCNKVLHLLCWHRSFLKSCQWLAVAHQACRLVARVCQPRQTTSLLPGSRPAKLAIAPAAAYAAALTSQQTCWQPAGQQAASHSFSESPPRTTFIQTDPCVYAKDNGGPREGAIPFFPPARRGPA